MKGHTKLLGQLVVQYVFELGQNIFFNSNKANTTFWQIEGEHVKGIINYEQEYLNKFDEILYKPVVHYDLKEKSCSSY